MNKLSIKTLSCNDMMNVVGGEEAAVSSLGLQELLRPTIDISTSTGPSMYFSSGIKGDIPTHNIVVEPCKLEKVSSNSTLIFE